MGSEAFSARAVNTAGSREGSAVGAPNATFRAPSRKIHPGTSAIFGLVWLFTAALAACATHDAPSANVAAPRHALLAEMALETKSPTPRAALTAPLGPEASPITFERIARYPEPGWHIPRLLGFSPDGTMVTYLESESQTEEMALFGLDVATGSTRVLVRAKDLVDTTKPISREEELRRERQRKKIEGVTAYRWAKRAPVMVLPMAGDVFLRRADGGTTRALSPKRRRRRSIPSSATLESAWPSPGDPSSFRSI